MQQYSNNQIIGISWMVYHCCLISVMSAMIKSIAEQYHICQIVFFHNIIAFLILLIFIASTKKYAQIKTQHFNLHVIRALLGVISLSIYFYAFTIMPLTQARAVALTGPIVSSIIAIIMLKEKMNLHRKIAIFIGCSGAMVILRPATDSFTFLSLIILIPLVMWAIIEIIIKILSKTESVLNLSFYLTGMMSLFSLPGALFYWRMPDNLYDLVILVIIGVIFLANTFAVSSAIKNADITAIMPFDFSGMVFTAIIAYFAFGEIIDIWTAIGAFIIITSSVYIAKHESNKRILATSKQGET